MQGQHPATDHPTPISASQGPQDGRAFQTSTQVTPQLLPGNKNNCKRNAGIAPTVARSYAPANGFSRNKYLRQSMDPKIPWMGPQSAHLWWLVVAKLQADSMPTA